VLCEVSVTTDEETAVIRLHNVLEVNGVLVKQWGLGTNHV
jgi:hypothetical protein